MPRIAFVGAGSTVFTRNLIGDVLAQPELAGSTFALIDVDAGRLETSRKAAEALVAAHGAEAAVARGDARALVEMDRAFHRAVARATHNAMLARWQGQLWTAAARWWVFAMGEQDPAEQLADIRLHRDLAAAIAAGDVAEAEAAMARLIGDPPSLATPALTPPGLRQGALDPA